MCLHTCVNVLKGGRRCHFGSQYLPSLAFLSLFLLPDGGRLSYRERMEEGKRRFEAFARENSLGGVDPDGGPPVGGLFRKKAALPVGVNVLNPPKGSEVIHARLEGVPRGASLDRGALSHRPSSWDRSRDRRRRRDPPGEPGREERRRRDTREGEPRDRRRRDDNAVATSSARLMEKSSRSDAEHRGEPRGETGRHRSERMSRRDHAEETRDPGRVSSPRSTHSKNRAKEPLGAGSEGGERSRSHRPAGESQSRTRSDAKESLPPPDRKVNEPVSGVGGERGKGVNPFHPSKVGRSEKNQAFSKQAKPPSCESEYYESEEEEPPVVDGEVPEEQGRFRKPALEPEYPVAPLDVPPLEVVPKGGGNHGGSKEKEDYTMAEFVSRAMRIHAELGARGVDMEVDDILRTLKGEQWTEAFQSLVRPKKAATGMRYVRLMETFLGWVQKHEEENGGTLTNPVGKDLVWLYLYDLTKTSVGRMTPKSFLHALQFFSEALGYPTGAVRCRRTRKLVDVHSKPTKAKSQAPMFTVETMDYLEQVVTEPNLPKGYRVAAGKLRLCIQASLRWDDLAKTHFSNVEWIRRKGENKVVGLRSKFGESKTGPRPWVASYLGVTREGDDWLCCLVNLLVEAHGERSLQDPRPRGKVLRLGRVLSNHQHGGVRPRCEFHQVDSIKRCGNRLWPWYQPWRCQESTLAWRKGDPHQCDDAHWWGGQGHTFLWKLEGAKREHVRHLFAWKSAPSPFGPGESPGVSSWGRKDWDTRRSADWFLWFSWSVWSGQRRQGSSGGTIRVEISVAGTSGCGPRCPGRMFEPWAAGCWVASWGSVRGGLDRPSWSSPWRWSQGGPSGHRWWSCRRRRGDRRWQQFWRWILPYAFPEGWPHPQIREPTQAEAQQGRWSEVWDQGEVFWKDRSDGGLGEAELLLQEMLWPHYRLRQVVLDLEEVEGRR